MRYSQLAPSPRWRKHIACYWFLSASSGEQDTQPIIPDGRMEWVFHLGDPFERIFPDGSIRKQARSLIIGQMSEPVVVRPTGRIRVVGIHFNPAGAMPFMQMPQSEWSGDVTELSNLNGSMESLLEERLAIASSEMEMRDILESALAKMYSSRWEPAQWNKKHDFPQRIIYRFTGSDSLAARIEGTNEGKPLAFDIPMKRVTCP